MIENLQDELYQLENKLAKGAKLRAIIRQELKGEFFSELFKDKNLPNQTITELYFDDNKSKYSSNSKRIFKFAKKIMKHFTLYTL